MSAFIVPEFHTLAVAYWAARGSHLYVITEDDIRPRFDALSALNTRSVGERYPAQCAETVAATFSPAAWRKYERAIVAMTPIEVMKACDCYQYQSNEAQGHKETDAWAYSEIAYGFAVGILPGYKEAPWDLDDKAASALMARASSPPVDPKVELRRLKAYEELFKHRDTKPLVFVARSLDGEKVLYTVELWGHRQPSGGVVVMVEQGAVCWTADYVRSFSEVVSAPLRELAEQVRAALNATEGEHT